MSAAGEFRRDWLPSWDAYADQIGMKLHGHGAERRSICDIHGGEHQSLCININSGAWQCKSCGACGGDVLAHHREVTGEGFTEAAQALGAWDGGGARRAGPTREEIQQRQQRAEEFKLQREADVLRRQQQVQGEVAALWKSGKPIASHPYADAKGIKLHGLGLRGHGGNLLVPMRDSAGALWNVQSIDADGEKRYFPGARVKGCYHAMGRPNGTIVLCEGLATGASLQEATGHAVAVAFDSGNLLAAATALRAKLPAITIVMAADDDWHQDGNPGITKATAAALAVGGMLAIPTRPADCQIKGFDFNDLHKLAGIDAVKRDIEAAMPAAAAVVVDSPAQVLGAAGPATWPQPAELTIELPAAPPFDAQAMLPPAIAEFVLDEADRMPCSPDYIAAALVVALGSVIGARCAIKPKRRDDWIVTPNLFGGVVGDPSSKKTPAVNTVMRFLDRLEAGEAEALVEKVKVYEAETAAFEARQSAVKSAMKTAASGKGDGLKMDAAVCDLRSLEAPDEPHERRFKSSDATVEKLGDLLVHNPAGMFVFRDELIGLLSSWEREGREGDRAFYLEGWNGTGSFNIDRIGRGSLRIPNACLSVFGGIQPDLLARYLSGIVSSLDNDGRIQRFQVMVYPEPVPWQWRDRYPVKGAREAVRDLFDRLANFDPERAGAAPADDFVKLPHFAFDDDAQEVFIEWSADLHHERIAHEPNPLMQQHFGKFEKLFCALALILHLAEGRTGPVQADTAIRAAAWCVYLEGHARRVYGLAEAAKVATAAMVGRRLAEGRLPDGLTARDVARKGWAGINTSMQAEAALAVLEERGWVRSIDVEDHGRPTTRYYINPLIRRVAS